MSAAQFALVIVVSVIDPGLLRCKLFVTALVIADICLRLSGHFQVIIVFYHVSLEGWFVVRPVLAFWIFAEEFAHFQVVDILVSDHISCPNKSFVTSLVIAFVFQSVFVVILVRSYVKFPNLSMRYNL